MEQGTRLETLRKKIGSRRLGTRYTRHEHWIHDEQLRVYLRDLAVDNPEESRVDVTEVTKEDEDRGCRNAGTKEQVALRRHTGYRMRMEWIMIGPETKIEGAELRRKTGGIESRNNRRRRMPRGPWRQLEAKRGKGGRAEAWAAADSLMLAWQLCTCKYNIRLPPKELVLGAGAPAVHLQINFLPPIQILHHANVPAPAK